MLLKKRNSLSHQTVDCKTRTWLWVGRVFRQADHHPAPGTGTSSHLRAPGRPRGCSLSFLLCAAHATHVSRIGGDQGSTLRLWFLLRHP